MLPRRSEEKLVGLEEAALRKHLALCICLASEQ
jgi:hypothetical protein